MSEPNIQQLEGEAMAEALYQLNTYAFGATPPLPNKEEFIEKTRSRQDVHYYVLYEDQQPAAGVAYSAYTQQVRGALAPMAGVWGVAASPETRRKGYVRQTMTRAFAAMRDEHLPLSCLYPFRESFYQRLGYVSFPKPFTAQFSPANLLPLLKQTFTGQVQRVQWAEATSLYREFLAKVRASKHGMALRDVEDSDTAQRRNAWMVVVREGGEVTGLMHYAIKEVGHFDNTFNANRFYYFTSQARYQLLEWIARHIDQTGRVEIHLPPNERPETWLVDLDVQFKADGRAPMGRVVDIAQLGRQGSIPVGPGRFSARISDPYAPWNENIWEFTCANGALAVRPTAQADCELSIHALAALLYSTNDPADFPFRGWGSPPPAVQAAMRSMFPPRLPYLHEFF